MHFDLEQWVKSLTNEQLKRVTTMTKHELIESTSLTVPERLTLRYYAVRELDRRLNSTK